MSDLFYEFLKGSQRVTAQIFYFRPLEEGQEPLKIRSDIIGQKATEIQHSRILQTFTYQKDDRPDLEDKRLIDVFASLVVANNGIINIADRSQRISSMQSFNGTTGPAVPLFIPRKQEETAPGMGEVATTFKTMVPFPKLRSFLQYWQDNLDGPIHQVQLSCGSVVKADLGHRAEYSLN